MEALVVQGGAHTRREDERAEAADLLLFRCDQRLLLVGWNVQLALDGHVLRASEGPRRGLGGEVVPIRVAHRAHQVFHFLGVDLRLREERRLEPRLQLRGVLRGNCVGQVELHHLHHPLRVGVRTRQGIRVRFGAVGLVTGLTQVLLPEIRLGVVEQLLQTRLVDRAADLDGGRPEDACSEDSLHQVDDRTDHWDVALRLLDAAGLLQILELFDAR
jgi:hypothetical protein